MAPEDEEVQTMTDRKASGARKAARRVGDSPPAKTTAQDVKGEKISPLADSVDQKQLAVSGMPTGGKEGGDGEDLRDGRHGMRRRQDPKDDPTLPDDVSAIADPEDPTRVMDPGEDPDFTGPRAIRTLDGKRK